MGHPMRQQLLQVWHKHFGKRLAIRPFSNHAQCCECVRYRTILKKLGSDSRGRSSQLARYMEHLRRQYRDRVCYWSARSVSRLPLCQSGSSVCFITDGMDKSKFRFPRTLLASSKEFSAFLRPCLDMSAVICHGHHVILAASLPYLKKDASWCCDLVCHSLHLLGQKLFDHSKSLPSRTTPHVKLKTMWCAD